MKKCIFLLLISTIFLGLFGSSKICLALPGFAAVSMNPTWSRVPVGDDVSINVVVTDVVNLRSWELKLFYETNCLDVLSITEGSFLESFAGASGTYFGIYQMNDAYNSTHGLVWAYCTLLGTPSQPATGTGTLATIKFRGSDSGTSHLTLAYPEFTYPVKLIDMSLASIPCITSKGVDVLVVETVPLDVNIDVGSLYFPEEQVECYIMTTYRGVAVAPTHINVMLYSPNGEFVPLDPQTISTGFCEVTYTMPSDALSGTWAVVVEAAYSTDTFEALGTSFKGYQYSSTLNTKLVHIDNTVAWIQTNVGLLQTDVSNLELHVTAIEGSTATIQTTLGTIQGTITSIDNDIATIQTDIGTIKLDISTIKTNTTPKAVDWTTIGLYVSLALLVSIAIVLMVLYLYLRARFRSGTAPG
jgi:hypothetical protein